MELQLQALHTAFSIDDMDIPDWRLHALSGDRRKPWGITVNKNSRIVFEFKYGHTYIVKYENYH